MVHRIFIFGDTFSRIFFMLSFGGTVCIFFENIWYDHLSTLLNDLTDDYICILYNVSRVYGNKNYTLAKV
jgi:hypothetical protein